MRPKGSSRSIGTRLVLVGIVVLLTITTTRGVNSSDTRVAAGNQVFVPLIYRNLDSSTLILGGGSRLGVWIGAVDSTTVGLLQGTGAKWTRVALAWNGIESVKGSYDFTVYDNILGMIGNAGISPIVAITANPSWAATTSCGPIDKDMNAFAAFLTALVTHYKDTPYNVKHWEFYNEPENRSVNWGSFLAGCWGNSPDKYAEMLQIASTAIKQADSEAKIVFGGLAQEQYNDPQEGPIFNTNFFAQVLDSPGGTSFDIANVHYFSSQSPNWSIYGRDIAGKVAAVRKTMTDRGLGRPVLVTELSWTSTPNNSPDIAEQQARYVAKALSRGLAIDLYAINWFSLADWAGADKPYGLVAENLQPRFAYQAYQTAAAEFGTANSIRALSPTEVGVTDGVEGYSFNVAGQERWVLWADSASVSIRLPGTVLSACDKLGTPIALSGSGTPTTLTLTDSPIYVRLQ